jgi:hypothetical protein
MSSILNQQTGTPKEEGTKAETFSQFTWTANIGVEDNIKSELRKIF